MGWPIIVHVSDANTDPRADGQSAGGVSEEQARAYLEQLRSVPADQVVVELLGSVLNAAQAKVGRNDARLFIDLCGLVFDHARPHLPAELTGQVEQMLGQLRLIQVEAESSPNRPLEEGDLPEPPARPARTDGGAPAESGQAGSSAPGSAGSGAPAAGGPAAGGARGGQSSSKLWLPGRDF